MSAPAEQETKTIAPTAASDVGLAAMFFAGCPHDDDQQLAARLSRHASALDALAAAVKPIRAFVENADSVALCSRYNPERARAYAIPRADMDALLKAISTLTPTAPEPDR